MKYIDIHTHHLTQTEDTVAVFNIYINESNKIQALNPPLSLSVHPWFINENSLIEISRHLSDFANPKIILIGECGLDKICQTDFNLQINVFKRLVEISEEFKKPLLIHCVKAINEIINIRKELKCQQKWIFHRFSGKTSIAEEIIDRGCFLSFGKQLLFNESLARIFRNITTEKVFFESDEFQINVIDIYKKAAEIKAINPDDIKKTVYSNFVNLFSDAVK